MKFELAREIVARFHDAAAAERAHAEFIARFQQGALPEQIDTVRVLPRRRRRARSANVLKDAGLVASSSEGNRMIDQGAVRVGDGAKRWRRSADREHEAGRPAATCCRSASTVPMGAAARLRAYAGRGAAFDTQR